MTDLGFCIFFLILSISLASALTIEDLITSYNYDFSDGTLDIIAKNDYMLDTNSNSINDTLIINLTSNATSGTYAAYIDMDDPNGKIIKSMNKTLSVSGKNFVINFSTSLLSSSKYNYTIRIEDSNNILVYEENNIETNTYASYETGTGIISMTDLNLNNNHVQINLTLNATANSTVNITVALKYNNSYISATEEKSLTIGTQIASIKFDNETIKSTHYHGKFLIDSVTIGDKAIDTNQNTSIYDYETFAKTSYIKSYSDALVDTDADGLSEFLEINFTVNAKTADTYNLEAEIYDEYNNYIALINETKTLSTGNRTIQARINGSKIYKTYINGPYVVSFTQLSIGNSTKDIVYDAYTTNISYYTDFERPPLPDLAITMNASFSAGTTNVTINITNAGEAPAFNVFLDMFDNLTYENQSSVSYLEVEESQIFSFMVSNTTNDTIFTAIADFDNFVDESDESNNVITNAEVPVANDSYKFYFKNTSNQNIAWFGNEGNIVLKGSCLAQSVCTPPSNSVIFRNSSHEAVAYIDSAGNLCLENGDCSDQSASCNPVTSAFVMRNASQSIVSYIDFTGDLCLIGRLYENSNP